MNPAKKRGQKRKDPPAPSAPKAIAPAKSTQANKASGQELVDAFMHITVGVPELEGRCWFSADQWMSILPKYWGDLQDKHYTVRMFTVNMNKIAQDTLSSARSMNGVYVNRYGRNMKYHYLFTTEEICPNVPTNVNFYISDMSEFVDVAPSSNSNIGNDDRQQSDDANSHNNSSNGNDSNTQQPQLLRSEQRRQQTWFHSGKAWDLFMPKSLKDSKPKDDEACSVLVRAFLDARIAACEEGKKAWAWYTIVINMAKKVMLHLIVM